MKYKITIDDKPAVRAIKRITKAIKELNDTPINVKVENDIE